MKQPRKRPIFALCCLFSTLIVFGCAIGLGLGLGIRSIPQTPPPGPVNCSINLPVHVMDFAQNQDGEGLAYVPFTGQLLRSDGLSAGSQLWILVNITNDGNGGFTAVENPSITTTYDAQYQRGHGFEIVALGYDPITQGFIVSDRLSANLAAWDINAVPIANYASSNPNGKSFGPGTWVALGGYYVDENTGTIYGVTKQFFSPPSLVAINRNDPTNTLDLPVYFADASQVQNLAGIAKSPTTGKTYVLYQRANNQPRRVARIDLNTGELFYTCFENITIASQSQINTLTFDAQGAMWFSVGGGGSTENLYAMKSAPEDL